MGDIQGNSNPNEADPCPLCGRPDAGARGSDGGGGTLILRQINATEAIYVCDNPECTYPVGEEVAVVERPVPELLSDVERDVVLDSKMPSSMPSLMNSDPTKETSSTGENTLGHMLW